MLILSAFPISIFIFLNCPVDLPDQLEVPDLHNSPMSAGSQLLQVPHVFVSALLCGAQVTVVQTVSWQTLEACPCSEALNGDIQNIFGWSKRKLSPYDPSA